MKSAAAESRGDSRRLYENRELAAIAARWDAKAGTWDRDLADPACHLNEDDGYARFLRQAHTLVKQRRSFCATHGVIDAGCGTGLVLEAVLSAFAWGAGVDISEGMIRVARKKCLSRAKFFVGDCFRLAAFCPKAGAVFSRGVLLSHYGRKSGELLLRAGKKALLPGGFLLFDFLNRAGRDSSLHAPENKTYFAPLEVSAMARYAGFRKVRILGHASRRVRMVFAEVD